MPSTKWSLLNRMIVISHNTFDARGFRQWEKAKRKVKKGARAFYILAPTQSLCYKCPCGSFIGNKELQPMKQEQEKICPSCNQEIEENKIRETTYFKAIPVFRLEDTEGKKLEYENLKLPDIPLLEVAEKWGIEVKAVPGNPFDLGSFSPSAQCIRLASSEECVFFHELAHAAHNKISRLKPGQNWKQEIVAELSACVLMELFGKTSPKHDKSYDYIKNYAEEEKKDIVKACLSVLHDVEEVIQLIVETAKKLTIKEEPVQIAA